MVKQLCGILPRRSIRLCGQSPIVLFIGLLLGFLLGTVLWPARVALATINYTVTSTDNLGANTLRQAILDANANPGFDTITFALGDGVHTIQPTTPLPPITGEVEIDGQGGTSFSCESFPLQPGIILDGSLAGAGANGLTISTGNAIVKGFYINNFDKNGVEITGSNVRVYCSIIGLDAAGNEAGNGNYGVHINGNNNKVGGNGVGTLLGNVVSGNLVGIAIDSAVSDNIIRGNYVGTDKNGSLERGNHGAGIVVLHGVNTTIGGATPVDRNVISGNDDQGVLLLGAGSGTQVIGNYIGLNADGNTPLPNATDGVQIVETHGATIGGLSSGQGNRIAYNDHNGVLVNSASQNNRILGNEIFSNVLLGIDLSENFAGDGVTFNDNGDSDSGANGRQNFPVITQASKIDNSHINVRGSFNGAANSSFYIEIFVSASCDESGFGEGASLLHSTTLQTNGAGSGQFDLTLAKVVALGQQLTMVATSNNGNAPGNSSEFSVCQPLGVQAASPDAPQLLADSATTAEDTAVTINVLANDSDPHSKPLTIVSVGAPDFGTAQIVNNKILYTPAANFNGDASFFYSAHNGDSKNTRQGKVVVHITPVNDAPTDILFSGNALSQDTPLQSTVGELSVVDAEPNSNLFFALVNTGQANDNANFIVFGSSLILNKALDLGNRSKVTLGLQVRDTNGALFAKTVIMPFSLINHPPSTATLSNNRIDENQAAGLTIGNFTATDVDPNDTHSFALVAGAGDADNAAFRIEGATLKTNALLDFEAKAAYSIRVRITDNGGKFGDAGFTINLNNVLSPPDAPENTLSFCKGDTITLINKDSQTASRRVSVTINNVTITNLTSDSCTVNGTMQIVTNNNTVSNLPFSGDVNARNQFSAASIPDFSLTVAGIPFGAAGVEIVYTSENPALHITQPSMRMPDDFGGLSADISVPTVIDSTGLRFGTGKINLPSITTKTGFELSLSGALNPAGDGFQIVADGTISIPNIGKGKSAGAEGQTCAISAGVTIFANSDQQTVMVIAAGTDYPQAVDLVRLDAIRAGVSCSPGLPIGSTGLFLTALSGEITLIPGSERVDVEVTIEAGEELPGVGPIVSVSGNMGFQPTPFSLDLGVAVKMLSIEVAQANAKITAKSFRATMSFQSIGYFGSVSIAVFSKEDGRTTFTGSALITIGIRRNAIFLFVPPFDINLASASADVGEFTNGNFGFKGNVSILSIVTIGFFIDSKGTTRLGNVNEFQLIDSPTVAAAHAAWRQAAAAGTVVEAAIADKYTFLDGSDLDSSDLDSSDDGNSENSGVIIRAPLVKPSVEAAVVPGDAPGEASAASASNVITQINLLQNGDVVFNLASFGPIAFTVITPEGKEVTPSNFKQKQTLGYVIDYTKTVSFQPADTLEKFAKHDTSVDVTNTLPRLLFTPLSSNSSVNHVDLKIDSTTVYFDLDFQSSLKWLKPTALTPGEHTVQLLTHGTNTVVQQTFVNLSAGNDYSLLYVGGSSAGFVPLQDNNAAPATLGKAKVRFYNGASATMKMVVNGAPLFTGQAYKTDSDYALVDAGTAIIEFRDNTSNALLSQPLVVDLANGGVYTFLSTDYSAGDYNIAVVQRQDALYKPTYLAYYSVDQAEMNKEWQLKLVGDTDNIPYQISVWGPQSPAILGSVMVDAGNLASTAVSWQLTADIQPVTVTVYANPGNVTTSVVVTNTNGTTSTKQIPSFQGAQVGLFKFTSPGELGGQLVTRQVDLSSLASGNYHLWIRADDGINAPVNAYASQANVLAAGVESVYGVNPVWVAKSDFDPLAQLAGAATILVDHTTAFPTTWAATINTTFERKTNSLYVEWRANSNPDIDSYQLLFGPTAGNPTHAIPTGGSIVEVDDNGQPTGVAVGFIRVEDIKPGVPYFISIEAEDTESGKSVRSQEVKFIAVANGFALTSPKTTLKVDAGDIVTVPVTLVADETLYFPNVWLESNLGGTPPGITARFLNAVDGDSNLNTTAPTRPLEISVDATVADGVYPLVITGYNGNAKQALTLNLVVGDSVIGVFMPMITR